MTIQQILADYRRCLKPLQVEEIFDVFLFRPIAYVLIKATYALPLTPNQITLMGIGAALLGAYGFAQGTISGFRMGGLLFMIAVVLDCGDGMLARLKKNGSMTGRLMDGLFDYITMISTLIALGIGLSRGGFFQPATVWLLIAVIALASSLQSMAVDYYKNQFVLHALGRGKPLADEIEEFKEEKRRLDALGGHTFDRLLIAIYVFYSGIQATGRRGPEIAYDAEDYAKKSELPLRMWTLIGPGTHRAALILAALLVEPLIYFYFVLIIGSVWMVILLVWQHTIRRSLTIEKRPARLTRPSRVEF